MSAAGILGLGWHAPAHVRTNDWWPNVPTARPDLPLPRELTPGMRAVVDNAARYAGDPFQGVIERRVLDPDHGCIDMEHEAASEAMERAGIAPGQIDLLLLHRVVPEVLLQNPACELHERLGLSPSGLAMHVEATAYSILAQIAIAEASVVAARTRYALLVQSIVGSRLADRSNPLSVVLGDIATAMVLGPAERGIMSIASFTDGRFPRSLVLERDGRLVADAGQLAAAQLQIADACKQGADAALARAGHAIDEVAFLAAFQGTAWLQPAVATHLGATHARSVDVFSRFGYLSSAAIPTSLYLAVREGLVGKDDLVLLVGGGTGQTYGAALVRWV